MKYRRAAKKIESTSKVINHSNNVFGTYELVVVVVLSVFVVTFPVRFAAGTFELSAPIRV